MKRWLAFLLALVMVFTLSACTVENAVDILDYVLSEGDGSIQEPLEDLWGSPDDLPEGTDLPPETPAPLESSEPPGEPSPSQEPEAPEELLDEFDAYTTKEDVALYIHQYGRLPDNFITKNEARKLGWSSGSLEPYAPGMCIGGDRFGNYEGLLPEAEGRTYTECDIDTLGASKRGAKRIVFSNDGLIYYTDDHYESFELLYGEE